MSLRKDHKKYRSVSSPSSKGGPRDRERSTFSGGLKQEKSGFSSIKKEPSIHFSAAPDPDFGETSPAGDVSVETAPAQVQELDYAAQLRREQREKARAREERSLADDEWRSDRSHKLTYIGIFLFTLVTFFRPYELFSALSGLKSMALVIAVFTLLVYVPTQFNGEGRLSSLSTEIKCILIMLACAVLTIPIARDPALAWATLSGDFSKVALIFIVIVNTLRSRKRLYGLMWLGIGAAVMLSFQAVSLYRQGVFKTEGYRVSLDFGGMFANPNDLAMHLAIYLPFALTMGLATKNKLAKVFYFTAGGLMVVGVMVTQSRSGFLGLLAMGGVLVWKFGRRQRVKVVLLSMLSGLFLIAFAPGNFGMRILSIFVPTLDPTGSSGERKELLVRSIIVTLRNPWGIGMGNFPLVGIQNRQTHNAYTQVSAELGLLALAAYVILLLSPLLKLRIIERRLTADDDYGWLYYLSIGVQASIVAYIVSSFFAAVAYNWFIYFPIAFAVCLRRIYTIQNRLAPDLRGAGNTE